MKGCPGLDLQSASLQAEEKLTSQKLALAPAPAGWLMQAERYFLQTPNQ